MRLLERTLKWVQIAPRVPVEDGLGGLSEGFSDQWIPVRASVIPSTGSLVDHSTGRICARTMCMLMPKDTPVAVGDGVLDGDGLWRCTEVQAWSAHLAVRLERADSPARPGL